VRFLRLTLSRPPDTRHPVQTFVETSDAIRCERNLGVADLPGDRWVHLSHFEGDADALRGVLGRTDTVESFDLTSVGERSFYAYVVYRMRPIDESFIETFDEHGVVVVMPVEIDAEGSTFTLVGPGEALGSLVEAFGAEMVVDVRRVGEFDHWHGPLAGRLTDRQREAVSAALSLGYYAVPRETNLDSVAEALDCAPGTASTLLRRAERTVMAAALDG
jgi:predicted DNA binding protein